MFASGPELLGRVLWVVSPVVLGAAYPGFSAAPQFKKVSLSLLFPGSQFGHFKMATGLLLWNMMGNVVPNLFFRTALQCNGKVWWDYDSHHAAALPAELHCFLLFRMVTGATVVLYAGKCIPITHSCLACVLITNCFINVLDSLVLCTFLPFPFRGLSFFLGLQFYPGSHVQM